MKLWQLVGLGPLLCIALSGCGRGEGPAQTNAADCAPALTPSAINEESLVNKTAQIHPQSMSPGSRRFLVKMRPTESGKAHASSFPQNAKPNVERINDEWQVVELKDGADPTALVYELMSTEGVDTVEPDFVIQTNSMIPNDPGYPRQWSHNKVSSLSAWDLTRGSDKVVVAIIDGGVEYLHSDLSSNIWHNPREVKNGRDDDGNGFVDDMIGWDFIGNDADPSADAYSHIHGTHVAGIIGAVGGNGKGIVGHAPSVRLMPLKYIGSDGTGYTSNAIRAIDYAVRNGAHIINASWSSSSFSQGLYDSIARARSAGVLVIAASGNDGTNIDQAPRYPAAFNLDNIVSVGATTSSDGWASYSNSGIRSVDVAAPGTSIYSTRTGGTYSLLSGTSMATPLVTAVAALVKSRHPDFNYRKIAGSLFLGVDRLSSLMGRVRFGGRINSYKALAASDNLAEGKAVLAEALLCPGE